MIITKQFLRDIKTANGIVIRSEDRHSTIDLFFNAEGDKQRSSATYDYDNKFKQNYTWHCFLYPTMHTEQKCILDLLKVDDNITFQTIDHSTDSLKNAGFTSEHLNIRIERHKKDGSIYKLLSFTFDTHTVSVKNAA